MQDRLLRCHRVVAALNSHVELDPRASYSIGLSMDSLTDLSDDQMKQTGALKHNSFFQHGLQHSYPGLRSRTLQGLDRRDEGLCDVQRPDA
jgi:hypothetical protein